MQRIHFFITATLCSFFYVTSAFAGIKIEQPLTVLSDQAKMAQITVYNQGDKKAYVQMEATEQLCAAPNALTCKNSQEKETVDSAKLTFSNPKFILRPQQKKVIYVIWRDDLPTKNRLFFINGRDMGNATTKKLQLKGDSKHNVSLNVIAIYKSRVLVAQSGGQFTAPTVTKEGNMVTVRNEGSGPARIKVRQFCNDQAVCDQLDQRLRRSANTRFLGTNQALNIEIKPHFTSIFSYFDFNSKTWKELETVKQ